MTCVMPSTLEASLALLKFSQDENHNMPAIWIRKWKLREKATWQWVTGRRGQEFSKRPITPLQAGLRWRSLCCYIQGWASHIKSSISWQLTSFLHWCRLSRSHHALQEPLSILPKQLGYCSQRKQHWSSRHMHHRVPRKYASTCKIGNYFYF